MQDTFLTKVENCNPLKASDNSAEEKKGDCHFQQFDSANKSFSNCCFQLPYKSDFKNGLTCCDQFVCPQNGLENAPFWALPLVAPRWNFPFLALKDVETQSWSAKFEEPSEVEDKPLDLTKKIKKSVTTSCPTQQYLQDLDSYLHFVREATKQLNVSCDIKPDVKIEQLREEQLSKLQRQFYCQPFEMSGQYPGHSRPPVGTPPPQTVWNHLTMSQAQGLNIHPTALTGAALNPGGFFSHPSMARTSHLNTVPQLAHTQAPATWHTPTVASKTVTGSNSPGNPLFSLQMLVDNRQNQGQNQVQNQNQSSMVGSQSTLDLSATSDLVENYSRLPQENPISLTARNLDKGSRNGSIISPPIPLNGDTSSDSGISSSVPTPNSLIEPVSLTTKELPKISVKNFETSLKAVGNVHDLKKTESNFVQKLMTLPPSVTIERVSDKKEGVIAQNPRNLMTTLPPLIVNLVSKEKDVVDAAKKESLEEQSARSPKSVLKRGRKGVDSLLEKLEGGSKKIVSDCVSLVVPEEREESVKSISPERQKSRSPTREEEVISPSFSNEDSNDNSKQRRKRKLEKPVRLSKDAKAELEELEQTETRTSDLVSEESTDHLQIPNKAEERVVATEEAAKTSSKPSEEAKKPETTNKKNKIDENEQVSRRRSSEGSSANPVLSSQRTRRKSEDDPVCASSPKETPESSKALNPFIEVESELEKMFAGIVETSTETKPPTDLGQDTTSAKEPLAVEERPDVSLKMETENDNSIQQSVSNLTDVSSSVDVKATPKKGKKAKGRGVKRKLTKSTDNIFENDVPVKETKKKRTGKVVKKTESAKKTKKNPKIDGLREITYDSGSNASSIRFRGPVVHIEGPRDSPLSIQVINAPREEEEEKSKEKRKNVGNGNAARSKRLSHQNDLDYRGKVSRAGLFSSTLSSRYDAHTTDSTWICVFCKQGPHSVIPGDPNRPHPHVAGPHIAPGTYTVPAGVLSDLFGPYVIGKERLEDGILSADEQEVMTEQKKGGKNKRSLRHAGLADQFTAKMGKKKKNLVENSTNTLHTGMTLIPGEEQRWEVWLHEQCAVWATGVYLAGGRVTGLQEAVWDAAKSICGSCEMPGANIGCIKRGCKAVTHYPCALTKGWHLDTSNYIPKCNLHRIT